MSSQSDAVWARFDATISGDPGSSPWADSPGGRVFQPDFATLAALLTVPIEERVSVQSGLHAKALDVWIARELRRAGFGVDEVWPRASRPRVMSREVALVLESLPHDLREEVSGRLLRKPAGAVSADATVLGKAYNKQVDVVISQWARGPELLISSKRMHSSLSNNAFNRIEESYGDAHNLRGRHPLAAIGYVLLIRGEAIRKSPGPAERLVDLVATLGSDTQGYDAAAVIVVDWDDSPPGSRPEVNLVADELVPSSLRIETFLQIMVEAVLTRTPVDAHVRVRELYSGVDLSVEEDESRRTRGQTSP